MKSFIEQKLHEALETKEKVLIIMRGVPSSGKSTLAHKLKGTTGVIHSTDDIIESHGDYNQFFQNMRDNKSSAPLTLAHLENFNNAKQSMNNSISPVVIDNTNIKPADFIAYVKYGLSKGYKIQMENIGAGGLKIDDLVKRNKHGVDKETMQSMIDRYRHYGDIGSAQAIEMANEE